MRVVPRVRFLQIVCLRNVPSTTMNGTSQAGASERVFKTAWFSKAARKAHIADVGLCTAIRKVMAGKADDLGGGVYKKRLGKNLYRSILFARGGRYWVYSYLFESRTGRISRTMICSISALLLPSLHGRQADIGMELHLKELLGICHDGEAEI